MTLQQLLYFREVSRYKSFTKAADSLYVVQSSLSHAISGLERELGVILFIRSPRREVELTDYGRTLLSYADYVLNLREDALSAIEKEKNTDKDEVKISFTQLAGVSLISRLFKAFTDREENRNIALGFKMVKSELDAIYSLYARDTDLVISDFVINDSKIISKPFAKKQLFVIMSANHQLAKRKSLRIEDIASECILQAGDNRHHADMLVQLFHQHGMKPDRVKTVDTWETMLAYAAVNDGVIVTSRTVANEAVLRSVPVDDPMSKRIIYISYLSDGVMNPAVEKVLAYSLTKGREIGGK